MNSKYVSVKNKATGRKLYYPLAFRSMVEVPCKTAREAIDLAEKIEAQLSTAETKTSVKSTEEFGAPSIVVE